jgi:glyoxylase I family protein
MKIEHIAFNVKEPNSVAQWYVANLGFQIIRKHGPPTHAHFLGFEAGQTMIEVYTNPAGPALDFHSHSALTFHLALSVENVAETVARLKKAGGVADGDIAWTDAGDELAIVRDPWGFPIQLVKRANPMA